jgi:hypothetical protein
MALPAPPVNLPPNAASNRDAAGSFALRDPQARAAIGAGQSMSRWTLFTRRSGRERLLLLEALAGLCWDKARVRWLPFRRVAATLGVPQRETPPIISAAERRHAVSVSWAVQAAARHAPIKFVCLPQAMTAQRMLRRRGIASTLYLGVSPDRANPRALAAHAWLRAGDKIVTGADQASHHRQLAWFAAEPRH